MEERIFSLERIVREQAREMERLKGFVLENHSPIPDRDSNANQRKRVSTESNASVAQDDHPPLPDRNSTANQRKRVSIGATTSVSQENHPPVFNRDLNENQRKRVNTGATASVSQVTTPMNRNSTKQNTNVNKISYGNGSIGEKVVNVVKPRLQNVANNVSSSSNIPSSSSFSSSSSRYPTSTASFATTSAAIHLILKSPTPMKVRRNRNILVAKTPLVTIREKKKKAARSISVYLRIVGPLDICEKISSNVIINRNNTNNTNNKINNSTSISNNNNNSNHSSILSSIISSSSNLKRKNTSSDLNGSLEAKRTRKMPITQGASVKAVNNLGDTESNRIVENAGIVNNSQHNDDDVVILNGRSTPSAILLSSTPRSETAAASATARKTGMISSPTSISSSQISPSSSSSTSSSMPRAAFITALNTAKAARTAGIIQQKITPQLNNIMDMTGDSIDTAKGKGRAEGDIETEKMNKVIILIKSLNSLVDRIQMVQQLLDTFQTKPVKTKKLIDAGKEVFQEWLTEEMNKFPENVDLLLVELILYIIDKATWTVDDVCRLRIDKTLRGLYKACCSTDKLALTSLSQYTNIISLTKKMWPRYRNMFKNVVKI